MYPILPYVVGPTFELVGSLCLVLTRSTFHAATLFSSLTSAIRETLWTFITIAIRLGPFRPHGSVIVDGAQLLRDATDTLCNPMLLIAADYRGTRYMARLPDMLCLAPATLDRIDFLAGLVSALLETPFFGDVVVAVISSLCFAFAADHVLFSAVCHWVKLYFGIYALEQRLYEKVATEHALAQQAADTALSLDSAKDRLAEVDRDVRRAKKLTRKLDHAKFKLRAAQDLERDKQREAEGTKHQVEVWRNRAVEVVENAKAGLAEVATRAVQAREDREAARAKADSQLAFVVQAIDTAKATTATLRADYASLVRSSRRAADQPIAHQHRDQSALVALLFTDKHKDNAEVQSAQAAHLTQLDSELAGAAQQYTTLSQELQDSTILHHHHMQHCGRAAAEDAARSAKTRRDAFLAEVQQHQCKDAALKQTEEQDAVSVRFVAARDDNKRAQTELDARRLRLEQRRAQHQAALVPIPTQLSCSSETLKKTDKDIKTARGEEAKWKEAAKRAKDAHRVQLELTEASRVALAETAEQQIAELASVKQAWETREQDSEHATDMQAIRRAHNTHLERLRTQHTKNAEQLLRLARMGLAADTTGTDSVTITSRKPLQDVQNHRAAARG